MDKRFIEESFPVKEVSEISVKEKNIRHGHISTLHIWWARRPLASSRATNYAAFIPAPKDDIDWVKKRNFIIKLSKWENSLNQNLLEEAKKEILEANDGKPPKVLDPFSGGGAIPLEALRLGCKTYANDYNPVAVLIEKCTLEYPQKYGNNGNWSEDKNVLANDVEKWSKWVLNQTKADIGKFYPPEENGFIPMAHIWAKTIKCQNPSCNSEIPLMKQFWLAKKKNKKVALKPIIEGNIIKFELVGEGYKELNNDFDPSKGTVAKAIVTCPVCGSAIDAKKTRKMFNDGHSGERMVAIVFVNPKKREKKYEIATEKDLDLFKNAEKYLNEKRSRLSEEWKIEAVPYEDTPKSGGRGAERAFSIRNYGLTKWGDLFNSRQKLALITFIEKIRDSYQEMLKNGYEKEYAKAICCYLSLILSRHSSYNASLCFWETTGERSFNVFGRSALPMVFDYAEQNPFGTSTGNWNMQSKITKELISNLSLIRNEYIPQITNSSSTSLPYSESYFDAVFTDPPYYDNVPYSYLSDFFYVWLKRTVGNLYPELFLTPLTPKKEEIVAYTHDRTWQESKEFFENQLKKSFKEIYRVLKPKGVAMIVYAHKTTEGWESVINSLLESGLTVTASWPVSTEMKTRLRAGKSAALASSIYIVARKIEKQNLGWYKEVKHEIKEYIPQKLDKLWQEGISGADFFIAAIGSSIEIFGKYEKILDNEGNEIRADKLLTFVRSVVTDYAMHQILHNGTATELSPLSKFYLLWRWNYQELTLPFDEARKLAQSAGIDLTNEWNKGFIVKRGDKISVQGPDKRDPKTLQEPIELIDVLHRVCLLWKTGKTTEMKETLRNSGYATNDAFYKVAQAISETLSNSSSEKKLIEGFLAGKDTIIQETKKIENPQTKLM